MVLAIGQRERGRDGNAVAGVHAHRVDVLDRTDDDEVVGAVAHHLEFVFLPADHRLLDENLVDGAQLDAPLDQFAELLEVVGDASTDAAHRERRSQNRREPHAFDGVHGFVEAADDGRLGHRNAYLLHRVAELEPILGDFDGLD